MLATPGTILPVPAVSAIAFRRPVDSGMSRPVLLRCTGESGEADYIVKLRPNIVRQKHGILYEFFASRLATFFGLRTPRVASVLIGRQLIDALRFLNASHPIHYEAIKNSEGFTFGSEWLGAGLSTWPVDASIPSNLVEQAAAVFAFDCLIDNENRSAENPNLLAPPGSFVIFDHELSFQFLGRFPANNRRFGWRDAIDARTDHPFLRGLKGVPVDLSAFESRLKELTGSSLAGICGSIPKAFASGELGEICDWLAEAQSEAGQFIRRIREVLK